MSVQLPDTINKSKPIIIEGLFIIIIGLVIVANTTISDIKFHDNYVLPAIETCFPENREAFCTNIRDRMGIPEDAQIEIGNAYWNELLRQAIFIGVILFLIRIGIGFFLQIQGIRKVRLTTVLMAIFWGLAGVVFFTFGFVDYFYFVFQGQDMPNQLDWLQNAGLFTETRSFTGDPNIVEKEDLYLTNALGVLVILTFLLILMIVFSQNGLKHRGIA